MHFTRKTTIQRRLLLALFLPILVVALVTGSQYRSARSRAATTRQQAALAQAAGGPSTLITAIMDERNMAGLELLGLGNAVTLRVKDSADARRGTDAKLASFKRTIANNTPEVKSIYAPQLAEVEQGLKSARAAKDGYKGEISLTNEFAKTVYDDYSKFIESFNDTNDRAVTRIDDSQMRNIATAMADTSRMSDTMSRLSKFAALINITGGAATPENQVEAANLAASYHQLKNASIALVADEADAREATEGFYARKSQHEFEQYVQEFLLTSKTDPVKLITAAADDNHPNAADVWVAMGKNLNARSSSLVNNAAQEQRDAALLFGLTILVSLLLAWFAARSIAKPLVRLSEQATRMADETLPDTITKILSTPAGQNIVEPELAQIASSSITEVAGVADALNSVQDRAISQAAEQAGLRRNFAESFEHLGRRVQTLVGTQVEMLDEMEGSEEDPDMLTKLFKLDHMATRIRRNAESLVMLAGPPGAVRRYVADPWQTDEVVRAAAQATDDYTRVVPGEVAPAGIVGWAGGEVANIIAEFANNGVFFSDPDSPVTIHGRVLNDGRYLFSVVDTGSGMSAIDLAKANGRLSGRESFRESPSKFLGHYVIGHIAARLGIAAAVTSTPKSGVTATVTIPADLMVRDGELGDGAPDGVVPESAGGSLGDLLASSRSLTTPNRGAPPPSAAALPHRKSPSGSSNMADLRRQVSEARDE